MQTKPPDIAATMRAMATAVQQQAAQLAYKPNRHERRAAKHARKRGKK